MNAFPTAFSTFLPVNHVHSGEHIISGPLFYQDCDSAYIVNALEFGNCGAASARCNGEANRREGMDKKCLHREIERERRNDMKSRYLQLTSLLPQSNTRGKASISDQLSEAAQYIRNLQENMDDLAKKRDDMKMKINLWQRDKEDNAAILFNECEGFPVVSVNHVGSCVVITTNTLREKMLLSELVLAVEEEGLQILTASSFTADDKVFHTLHCKVLDLQNFETKGAKLQKKLWQLI